MDITKRNGSTEQYDKEKIATAVKKSFISTKHEIDDATIYQMVQSVEDIVCTNHIKRNMESIQDEVEKALMKNGCYAGAKSFILFRWQRTEVRRTYRRIAEDLQDAHITEVLKHIAADFTDKEYSILLLIDKYASFSEAGMTATERVDALIKAAVELTTQEAPEWEFITTRLLNYQLNKRIARFEDSEELMSLYDKMKFLTDRSLYGAYILQQYSKAEIEQAATFVDASRSHLLNYSGLGLLIKRYVIRNFDNSPVESVQEMFLGIALHLTMNGPQDHMTWVQRFYNVLSKLQVTMATPTLSNAREPFHQLSSCFIDTVPGSLGGIYRSIDNFAQVSRFGGGMGLYFGKVRAAGGRIRGFKGAADGVIRWMKLVNDTAVTVDRLGVRQGAVAVYLDVWHKGLPEFLQLRTNNGDDRMKAHDIFPAICYPDLFWKMAEENLNQDWYVFCPNEVMTAKGYNLEDYCGEEWEKRYWDCVADTSISRRIMPIKGIIRLILRSAMEAGTPFTFNRDTVNRANPNHHKGIIYCSNLCTEITQNMSQIEEVSNEIRTEEGDTVVVRTVKPGDFVVCNLASLSLGHLKLEGKTEMKEMVSSVVRALDDVIDLNFYPLPFAKITNHTYRSIGLGVSGYHHALAIRDIKWESEEHLSFVDKMFERINRLAIEASSDIAKQGGSYKCFEGSDWQTGEYFTKRQYTSPQWKALARKVNQQGMRNAYLLAIAPTSSTSIIAATTADINPVIKRFFLEEEKGAMLPRVAPSLSDKTYWMYKSAYLIDQSWSMRAAGIGQKHIDQAQSVNLYITSNYTMRQLLGLCALAWHCGVKTIYYIRSKSLEVKECESCAS